MDGYRPDKRYAPSATSALALKMPHSARRRATFEDAPFGTIGRTQKDPAMKIKCGQRHQAVPPGEYRVKVTDIREGTFVGKRRSIEFIFEISDGEHFGKSIRGYANAHYDTFSEYTKLRQWIQAVTRIDSEPGCEIDLDVFYGKILRAQIESKKSRKTGNTFSNVTNILGVVCDLE